MNRRKPSEFPGRSCGRRFCEENVADTLSHLHIVIVCDNAYHDLWPFARHRSPRDLLTLTGDDASLVARMVRSCLPFSTQPIHLVCDADDVDIYRNHLVGRGTQTNGSVTTGTFPEDSIDILGIPSRKNNAFPITLMAALLRLSDPDAIMLVLRGGIRFEGDELFESSISRAYRAACADQIALIGVRPTTPSTVSSHGLIKHGSQLDEVADVYRVNEFIDRAHGSLAARLSDPKAFWYTGISMMRASMLLGEMHRKPDIDLPGDELGSIRIAEVAGFLAALGSDHWNQPDAREVIATLPDPSIGECVFERSDKLALVTTSMEWQDVSTLRALDELETVDESKNRLVGNTATAMCTDTTIYAGRRLVATLGIKGLLVVDTPDATLVAQKDKLDNLDSLLETLRDENAPELEQGAVFWESWGKLETLEREASCVVRRIEVTAGRQTPLSSHNGASEQLTVISGTGQLHIGNRTHHLAPRVSYCIDPQEFYSIEAGEDGPLVLVSVCVDAR